MATFFTADLHINHRNIIAYCNRPFRDVDHMNTVLVDNWNSVVSSDDTVFVLGDYALGDIDASLSLTSQLAGRKILVIGNHDRMFLGQRQARPEKIEYWTTRYLDAGFHGVQHGTAPWQLGPHSVQLSHFPYADYEDDRYVDHRPTDDGRWLLCGHVHDRWKIVDRMINVGVDVWDYTPVHEDTLTAIVDS